MNDMDILALSHKMIAENAQSFTLDDVGFFRSNAKMQELSIKYKELLELLVNWMQNVAKSYDRTLAVTSDVELTTTLDFWHNMLLGRSGDAHSHLME